MAIIHVISDLFFTTTVMDGDPFPRFPPKVRVVYGERKWEITESFTHVVELRTHFMAKWNLPAWTKAWRNNIELEDTEELFDEDVIRLE